MYKMGKDEPPITLNLSFRLPFSLIKRELIVIQVYLTKNDAAMPCGLDACALCHASYICKLASSLTPPCFCIQSCLGSVPIDDSFDSIRSWLTP